MGTPSNAICMFFRVLFKHSWWWEEPLSRVNTVRFLVPNDKNPLNQAKKGKTSTELFYFIFFGKKKVCVVPQSFPLCTAHFPVAQVGDAAHHADILAQDRPDHSILVMVTWGKPAWHLYSFNALTKHWNAVLLNSEQ